MAHVGGVAEKHVRRWRVGGATRGHGIPPVAEWAHEHFLGRD
jgi:hypothetical protein